MASTGLQVAGLASNFDWKSFIDQIMQIESAPITRIQGEQATNTKQSDLLSTLGTKLTAFKGAADALNTADLFGTRKASSSTSGSTWTVSAAANTAVGTYKFNVTKLATATTLTGTSDIGAAITDTTTTIANLPTAQAINAGTFSVNGKQVTVATTDKLSDVLAAINTATGGDVTATYNPDDTVTLSSTSGNLVLGASNDSSNFLTVMKLYNNVGGTSPITSSGKLGVVKQNAALSSGNFTTAVTGDGSGNGAFTINGTSITYNTATDTLSSVISKINKSGAGVTASYDALSDRVTLKSNNTGNLGLAVSDTTGNLMTALGLVGGTTVRGDNAEFTLNNNPTTYVSASNTLDASVHGITGLSVTVDSTTTQSITVSADTSAARSKIDSFISTYNDVQQFLDDETKITSVDGKITTAPLYANHEIQEWGRQMRSRVFSSIGGLSGSIDRMDQLGIDFDKDDNLVVYDSSKLDSALANNSTDVAQFFQTSTTGFADRMSAYLSTISDSNTDQQKRLTDANTSLDDQIAAIQRHLDQERDQLTTGFVAMEQAQSQIQSQQQMLTRAFGAGK